MHVLATFDYVILVWDAKPHVLHSNDMVRLWKPNETYLTLFQELKNKNAVDIFLHFLAPSLYYVASTKSYSQDRSLRKIAHHLQSECMVDEIMNTKCSRLRLKWTW